MPSQLTTPHAREIFRNLAVKRRIATLKAAADYAMESVKEAEEPNQQNWNPVSRAHLFDRAVECLLQIQDISGLLEVTEKTEAEIEKARARLDEPESKEALLLLYKAKVRVMHNRQEYGYLTLNLEAIEAVFGREELRRLLEESREACKAYISILCLCFQEQWDAEYQLGACLLQARLDEAKKLNQEVLVAKHGYHKYTPKLKVYQLRVKDSLTTPEFADLSLELLKDFPSVKHALDLIDLQVRRALRMDIPSVAPLLEKQRSMIQDEFTSDLVAQSLPPFKDGVVNQRLYAYKMNEMDYALITKKMLEQKERTDQLIYFRQTLSGIPTSEDLKFYMDLTDRMTASNVFFIVASQFVFETLPLMAKLTLEQLKKWPPCFFGFSTLLKMKQSLNFFEMNPACKPRDSNIESLQESRDSLLKQYREADEQMKQKWGPSYKACYSLWLDIDDQGDIEDASYEGLLKKKTKIQGDYRSLKESIDAGTSPFSMTSEPVRLIEGLLILILKKLSRFSDDFSQEMFDLQMSSLANFTSSSNLSQHLLHNFDQVQNKERAEQFFIALKALPKDEISMDAQFSFYLLLHAEASGKTKVLIQELKVARELRDSSGNSEELAKLSEQASQKLETIFAHVDQVKAQRIEELRQLAKIFGTMHFITVQNFIQTQKTIMKNEIMLGRDESHSIISNSRKVMIKALDSCMLYDEQMMAYCCKMENNQRMSDILPLYSVAQAMIPRYFELIMEGKEEFEDPENQAHKTIIEEFQKLHQIMSKNIQDVQGQVEEIKKDFEKLMDKEEPNPFDKEAMTNLQIELLFFQLAEVYKLYYSLDTSCFKEANRLFGQVVRKFKAMDKKEVDKFESRWCLEFRDALYGLVGFRKWAEEQYENEYGGLRSLIPSKSTLLWGSVLALGTLGVAWARLRKHKN